MTFFKDVFNIRDNSADIGVNEFSEKMRSKEALLLDIRTPAEFRDIRIDGALNINYFESDFFERISEIDQGRTILLYCRSGNRSYNAVLKMKRMGYKNSFHLQGGIIDWVKNNKPVIKE